MFSLLLKPDTAALILRLTLGLVLLAHSLYLKLLVYGLPATARYFESIGLPAALAYSVFLVEVVAGIALILGIRTRLFAALAIPVLLGATWAHAGNGWLFTNNGGGWEYPLFLSLAALVQLALGGGRYALSSRPFKSTAGERP